VQRSRARGALARLAAAGDIHRTAQRRFSGADGELQRFRDVTATADARAAAAGFVHRSGARRFVGTTAGSGTMGRVLSDPSLYANADSLVMELRALVADVKAHPKKYVNIRVF
jgi:phospholipid/cholesterol/gamma-HCH transport system substrate-binding protein